MTASRRDSPRVAIVGGGAVGLRAAADLADRGADVTVYERGTVGSGASGRAAGVVYDAYADPEGAALAGRSIARFRAAADRAASDDATVDPFDFDECPYVLCARAGDEKRVQAVGRVAERMREQGRSVETVEPDTLGRRFPAVETDDLAAAFVAHDAGRVDTAAYTRWLADEVRDRGVAVHTDCAVRLRRDPVGVERLATDDTDATPTTPGTDADVARTRPTPLDDRRVVSSESYDAVCVAAGAHTAQLLSAVGAGVAVVPYRVQALTASVASGYDAPTVFDASSGVYVRPHPTGLLAGDGTVPEPADPDGYDRRADDWFVDDTRRAVRKRFGFEPTVERAWAGVCTATPDGMPMLGRCAPGLYAAAGWQGHGFMRSPAHGELLAACVARDLAVGDDPVGSLPHEVGESALAAFDPTRHDPDREFQIREGMVVTE